MNEFPSPEWLSVYESKKQQLTSFNDFNEYFNSPEIFGKKLFHLNAGEVKFPTGEILVCDPLAYLDRVEKPYFTQVPVGTFPVEILVVEVEENHHRYAAVRIKFTENEAKVWYDALKGMEDLEDLKEDEYFGFNVDAGLATVVDVKTQEAYCDFVEDWIEANPNGNIYDDFFAELFTQSFKENPSFQREGGDWINFKIPGHDLTVPMIQSGFGDGTYPVYFGYDDSNSICELIIQFIDIEMAFSNE